ncbi:5-formyltetrahydrofolate cyclo-ligase [Alkalihalobacillus sp. AL-G]|uniref:5-formyltetrahydrofolate cyclo-ligase n=1 Tax=Alkalihalobacillus sp. AL-G TaxID=2926399 RepID=UPI00272B167E|nr:5-formyltetrahydrofolate cyclo-ligase [Alkalihalobacillus sp. AL-G]WLD92070.1 5-formyltetrahydrofolate cyclo-ligase [Alkalihalobacillus sp. AL-G]
MTKQEIRKSIQKQLVKMPKQEREHLSRHIRDNLFATKEWKSAETIGVTVSRGAEIDTYPIIRRGWEDGKSVVVPKCHPGDFSMDFRKLQSFDELETVYFGLKEPIIEETQSVSPDQIDLLIVPGLAYDESGYRVGFGGGYYDRYLQRYSNRTVSLLFPSQLVNELPRESFDFPVDGLILPDLVKYVRE